MLSTTASRPTAIAERDELPDDQIAPAAGRLQQLLGDQPVGADWQMMTVLLGRADRDGDGDVGAGRLGDLRPRHIPVQPGRALFSHAETPCEAVVADTPMVPADTQVDRPPSTTT